MNKDQGNKKISLTVYRHVNQIVHASKPSQNRTVVQRIKGKRNQPEWILQQQCVSWAELHTEEYPYLNLMFHPASGVGRTKTEANELRSAGAKKGVPRLIIPVPNKPARKRYNGLAVEIKSPSGCLSSEQEDWQQHLKRHGYLCVVVRTLKEFIEAVKVFHHEI